MKLNAPLQARGEGVLMIDSDLNLLKMPEINMADMHIYSSFRQGKMIAKLDGAPAEKVPAYYKETVRPYLVDHVNGAFLAATKRRRRICPLWLTLFRIPGADGRYAAADRSAAARCAAGHAGCKTVNPGDWMNWPVSKKIGGQEAVVPKEVIGAHGGFPLSEWQKYLESPDNKLLFKGQDYTRKVRYLTDEEISKKAAGPFSLFIPAQDHFP